jgi:hypothetical protein
MEGEVGRGIRREGGGYLRTLIKGIGTGMHVNQYKLCIPAMLRVPKYLNITAVPLTSLSACCQSRRELLLHVLMLKANVLVPEL